MAAQERKVNSRGTIAVVGDSPFAGFLAGLLAAGHGRETILIATAPSPLRIPRAPALSIAPLLRPESWRLSLDTTPEALKLLARIGPRVSMRTAVVLAASGAAQSYALEHVRHLAVGFGRAVEPTIPAPAGFDAAYRIRDAHRLVEVAFLAALPVWLEHQGVTVIPPDYTFNLHRDGSATIGNRQIDHVVLADDAAVATHCDRRDLDAIAHRIPATAFRTEPVAPLANPVLFSMGGAFTLTQTSEATLDIVARGHPSDAAKYAGRFLADPGSVRLAARSTFDTLVPRDGAPVVGPLRQTRATVLVGLGPQALFIAPAIARILAGQPTAVEQAWVAARSPNRDFARSAVAEYAAAAPEAMA